MKKVRLDEFLKENNIVEEKLILPMIMAGEIYVNDNKATSVAQMIEDDSKIEIRNVIKKYVSRGGFKLEAAINQFKINVKDLICADFGASTGGFTDVLIQNGAKKVYAIETAQKELAEKLRNNAKVINMQGVSLFDYNYEDMPWHDVEKIDLTVCDLSFIPLKNAIPKIFILTKGSPLIALLKPHYEAQDESILENGVVKNDEIRQSIVDNFKTWLIENNYKLIDITESPIKGGGGNIEYLCQIEA